MLFVSVALIFKFASYFWGIKLHPKLYPNGSAPLGLDFFLCASTWPYVYFSWGTYTHCIDEGLTIFISRFRTVSIIW